MNMNQRISFVASGDGHSADKRLRVQRKLDNNVPRVRSSQRKGGLALVSAMLAIAILAVMLTDFHEHTSTSFAVARAERDRLKAEYLAISAINLTRLLIVNEPRIRAMVGPILQAFAGRAPSQLPIWKFANELLIPFCEHDKETLKQQISSINLQLAKGLDDIDGSCEIMAVAENSKINVNKVPGLGGDVARRAIAVQLYSLTGGNLNPSPYDDMFSGNYGSMKAISRLDVIANLIDWWDFDQNKTTYDPTSAAIDTSAPEDNSYRSQRDAYSIKNAPYDSLDELHLVSGVSEDFWATFVQPKPSEPDKDLITVYGTAETNPNEARPEVLLARVCAILINTTLCRDPLEGAKFVQLMTTVRGILPIPWFRTGQDFINFISGKGGPNDLFSVLTSFLGQDTTLMFRPVVLTNDLVQQLAPLFNTESFVFTIQATSKVGDTQMRIRTVANFHSRWVPPPPNAGTLPPLGVLHYWRVE